MTKLISVRNVEHVDYVDFNESAGNRIRRLQNEARCLAKEHVGEFMSEIDRLAIAAGEIANGGEAYPAGIRDLARRLTEDLTNTYQSMDVIRSRN